MHVAGFAPLAAPSVGAVRQGAPAFVRPRQSYHVRSTDAANLSMCTELLCSKAMRATKSGRSAIATSQASSVSMISTAWARVTRLVRALAVQAAVLISLFFLTPGLASAQTSAHGGIARDSYGAHVVAKALETPPVRVYEREYARMHACKDAKAYAHTPAHTHAQVHALMCAHAWAYTHMRSRPRVHVCTRANSCSPGCAQASPVAEAWHKSMAAAQTLTSEVTGTISPVVQQATTKVSALLKESSSALPAIPDLQSSVSSASDALGRQASAVKTTVQHTKDSLLHSADVVKGKVSHPKETVAEASALLAHSVDDVKEAVLHPVSTIQSVREKVTGPTRKDTDAVSTRQHSQHEEVAAAAAAKWSDSENQPVYRPSAKWFVFRGNEAAIDAFVSDRAAAATPEEAALAAEMFQDVAPANSLAEWKRRYPDWQPTTRKDFLKMDFHHHSHVHQDGEQEWEVVDPAEVGQYSRTKSFLRTLVMPLQFAFGFIKIMWPLTMLSVPIIWVFPWELLTGGFKSSRKFFNDVPGSAAEENSALQFREKVLWYSTGLNVVVSVIFGGGGGGGGGHH